MCALNENRMFKNPFVVKPDFIDTFPHYKGDMNDKYGEMKTKKTKEARENLVKDMTNPQEDIKDKLKQIAFTMREQGFTNKQIGLSIGYDNSTIGKWLKGVELDSGKVIANIV